MRMMTITECVAAMGGKVTREQLRHGIRMGYYRSVRIGRHVMVDLDTVEADVAAYRPQHLSPRHPNGGSRAGLLHSGLTAEIVRRLDQGHNIPIDGYTPL